MEQPPIYEVPIGEKKDKSPEIQDLEEVIELDRPISPNKSDIYPTIPQYLGPTRQYQQEQYCQNGMQCPPPITFVQPANPTACYYPPQSIGLISQPQRLKYGPKSMEVTCTNCHQHVHTKISKNVNSSGWICTGMFCFFAPCLFWIPVVCIDNCQDTVHKCSNCGIFLGKQCNWSRNSHQTTRSHRVMADVELWRKEWNHEMWPLASAGVQTQEAKFQYNRVWLLTIFRPLGVIQKCHANDYVQKWGPWLYFTICDWMRQKPSLFLSEQVESFA